MVIRVWLLNRAVELTNDTDVPDFDKGALDVLDVGQTLVQIQLEHVTSLWVAFCDGSKDPTTTQDRLVSKLLEQLKQFNN